MRRNSIQQERNVSSFVASTSAARKQYLDQRMQELEELKTALAQSATKILTLVKEQDNCKARIAELLRKYTKYSSENEKVHAEALEKNIEINRYMMKRDRIHAELSDLKTIIDNEKTTNDEYQAKYAEKIDTWDKLLAKIEENDAEMKNQIHDNELAFQRFCLELDCNILQVTKSIGRLEQENADVQLQINGKLEAQKELNDRKDELCTENEAAMNENKEMKASLDELNNLNATKQNDVERLQLKLENLDVENSALENAILLLEDEVKEFTEALHTLSTIPIDTLETIKIQLADTEKSVQENKQYLANLDEKKKKLLEDIDLLRSKSENTKQYVNEERLKITPKMFETAQNQLNEIMANIEAAQIDEEAQELETRYNNEIKELETELATLDERLKLQEISHGNELKKYSKEVADLTKQCNLKKESIYIEMRQLSSKNKFALKPIKKRRIDNASTSMEMNHSQTSGNEEDSRVAGHTQSSDVSSSQNSVDD